MVFFFPDFTGLPGYRGSPTPQVYFWDRTAAGEAVPLSGLPEGAVAAVISGDGAFAWVTTKTNRLLRFDLNQGASAEILSAFPVNLGINGPGPVPGSAFRFTGSRPIAGEHFRFNDLEFPVLPADGTNQTLLQAPWELASQTPSQSSATAPMVLRKDGYPFELALGFGTTNQITPKLEELPPTPGTFPFPIVKALSADFSYQIDDDHPAISGQTIVVWLTGLGPLDQPVATGVQGPYSPPAHPLALLECGLASLAGGPTWRGLELPFISYAPGLVGVYQVNVTIPADWPVGVSQLDCYSGTQTTQSRLPIGAAN